MRAKITVTDDSGQTFEGECDLVPEVRRDGTPRTRPAPPPAADTRQGTAEETAIDLAEIVRLVKNSDEAEAIERNILNRSSQVGRTLLPLYIVREYLKNAFGLLSGEISKDLDRSWGTRFDV